MRAAALALASGVLAASAPSASAHCYKIWKNPWPQHCGGIYERTTQAKDKTWYVEITTPPPVDERSPQDIADQAEHDAAVKAKHDEINLQMMIIKAKEAEGINPNE